jgi:molybdopterin-binding protein
MTQLRISEVAALLRVSDDTVRRWVDQGRLRSVAGESGRKVVDGVELARFVRDQREEPGEDDAAWQVSARNRLDGVVTDVQRDGLVAQVEIQAGPFRLVSLMTREAADALELEPGSLATAVVKSTVVVVEAPFSGGRA